MREAFPSVGQAALLLLAHFLLRYVLGALLYDFRQSAGLTIAQIDALVMLLANGLVLASVMHHRHMSYRDLVHPARSAMWVTAVMLVPPVLLLVPGILLLDHGLMAALHRVFPLSLWEQQAFASMVTGSLPAVLAACVLAPVLEEMLFRGVLLRAFLAQHSRWAAICFSALFFGAVHLNVYQFVLAFWLGLLLGWLFERSRSLVPCIALHAGVNAAVVALAQAQAGRDESVLDQIAAGTWLLSLAAAVVGALVLRRLLAARRQRAGRPG